MIIMSSIQPREKTHKKNTYFPLYWLCNREWLFIITTRVGFHPLHSLNNHGVFFIARMFPPSPHSKFTTHPLHRGHKSSRRRWCAFGEFFYRAGHTHAISGNSTAPIQARYVFFSYFEGCVFFWNVKFGLVKTKKHFLRIRHLKQTNNFDPTFEGYIR